MKFQKLLLTSVLACGFVGASVFGFVEAIDSESVTSFAQGTFGQTIETGIKEINNEGLDNGNSFVIALTKSDYMTATEWNNQNYKWLNDEFGTENREAIDYENKNVANAFLDKNLEAYNFAEKILFDGQTLAQFSQAHPYKLIANKRTRVNTISIDFAEGVLQSVETVEILDGCQLPTLAYAYRGLTESSCLEIAEGKKYMQVDGVWADYFEGYAEDKEYKGTESTFKLNFDESLMGHPATPLNGYTDIFMKYDVQGEKLDHKILVSGSNTVKGNVMALQFTHPIDSKQFKQINLRVYINHAVAISAMNAGDVTADALGNPLETFSVSGGMFSYLSLTSAFYANSDGMVDTILFRFEQDCAKQYGATGEELYDSQGRAIRDTFHFVSFNVANPELITKDSLTVLDEGDAYRVTFRFNKAGTLASGGELDLEKVTLNGYTLAEIQSVCPDMIAEWEAVKGIYQIGVTMPKAYDGIGAIRNPEYEFANNHVGVEQGLQFPNGDVLDRSYACHLYSGEKILDMKLASDLTATKIQYVQYSYDEGSGNLRFNFYFDKNVASVPYYHACETEHWRSHDLYQSDNTLYDGGISEIFLNGGYKSSLMNSVLINRKTIGEWHAHDPRTLTNVQTHYGNMGLNSVSVIFAKACPNTYDGINALVESGEGVVIEVMAGWKFMVNTETKAEQTFVLKNGSFTESVDRGEMKVYFDGIAVEYGDVVVVKTLVSEQSIAVTGCAEYTISSVKDGNVTTYTVAYGEGESFVFSVRTDAATVEVEESGCGSVVATGSLACLGAAVAWMMGGRRKREEVSGAHSAERTCGKREKMGAAVALMVCRRTKNEGMSEARFPWKKRRKCDEVNDEENEN